MAEAARAAVTRAEAAGRLPSRIAFLGFGLIGGSIAAALRVGGARSELVAWTPNGAGPAAGARRGLLDAVAPSPEAALKDAALVVLAGPPLTVVRLLSDFAGPLRRHLAQEATITDVASTKALIVENASAYELPFVGGHPMAGREVSGVAGATEDLFIDRPWVVVPTAHAGPRDIDRVETLALALGARPVRMTATDHDVAVAAISHLPLVLAAALVESVVTSPEGAQTWATARSLAATGWSDMTRLVRGDPEMGAGILSTNAAAVADRLRALRRVIDDWIELTDPAQQGGVDSVIWGRLQMARDALERESGI
jgi:prephenate dehydrogenase